MASVRVCLLIALMISCVIVSSNADAIDDAVEGMMEVFKEQARRELVLNALKTKGTEVEETKRCFPGPPP